MARRSGTDVGLLFLGLLALVAAGLFAVAFPTVEAELPSASGGTVKVRTTNLAAAAASGGFALGGGLCLLGAVLAARASRRDDSP
jgi:hypothetical protein